MKGKLARLNHWLSLRTMRYIITRVRVLTDRYGLRLAKAEQRIINGTRFLARFGCLPSYPTPGRVVEHSPDFFRRLEAMGAELSVHSYDHVDFRSLTEQEATYQLERANVAFKRSGLRAQGFRCPYMSYTDDKRASIHPGMYRYSSNKRLLWEEIEDDIPSVKDHLSVPWFDGDMVEIPVSLPSDLFLYDQLQSGKVGMARAWLDILRASYRRGEMFIVLFHPETFHLCTLAFALILAEARASTPPVWAARLCDISDWWWEKVNFSTDIAPAGKELDITFYCSPRATILARNLTHRLSGTTTQPWYGFYQRIVPQGNATTCRVRGAPWPFVGVTDDVAEPTRALLRNQGYIVLDGEHGARCGLRLSGADVPANPVRLVHMLESSDAPLLRYWRWPEGYRSVVSITGDLDALNLFDYILRAVQQ